MQQPLASGTRNLLAMNKTRTRTCIGLLTGHATLRAHLYNLGLAEQENCRLCGEERQHTLSMPLSCPSFKMFLCPRDINKVKVGSL
ncbi:hypothetical protein WH47_12109 [Habropoda laboriosa]|uniref:Uncharacterized protein n=1 Tax=Habropoda laboriosa TaxID=597456 RepID=A0A0L7R198_9HYME|nr:hypothetical protein WH47_12109 [Habropoda laboriosa]